MRVNIRIRSAADVAEKLLQSLGRQHLIPQIFSQLMQAAESNGHLDEHEEVDVEHSVRRLRLHRCDHSVAASTVTTTSIPTE